MFKGLKSLLTGILAGTAVGVLFSPKKGKELRQNFKKELKEGGTGLNTVKSTFKDMGKEIGDYVDHVKETEEFKKGKAKVKKYAGIAKKEAKKIIKKNVSARTIKKAEKLVDDAKETVKRAVGKVKKATPKKAKSPRKKKNE